MLRSALAASFVAALGIGLLGGSGFEQVSTAASAADIGWDVSPAKSDIGWNVAPAGADTASTGAGA
ncbi:hypothetical protein LRE75_23815 [Streptomyces sp. 372A]|uniref:hypothetical protein n=1 Tax=Streptomyces sp. SAS_281 TaxID=3412744 RepID=UPI00403CCCB6